MYLSLTFHGVREQIHSQMRRPELTIVMCNGLCLVKRKSRNGDLNNFPWPFSVTVKLHNLVALLKKVSVISSLN